MGPFAAELTPGHPLLELQHARKLSGTKNNRVLAQLGQILDPKTQLPLLKSWEHTVGVGSRSPVLPPDPRMQRHQGVG